MPLHTPNGGSRAPQPTASAVLPPTETRVEHAALLPPTNDVAVQALNLAAPTTLHLRALENFNPDGGRGPSMSEFALRQWIRFLEDGSNNPSRALEAALRFDNPATVGKHEALESDSRLYKKRMGTEAPGCSESVGDFLRSTSTHEPA